MDHSILETHLVTSLPPTIHYIPDFLTPAEESSLLSKLPPNRWTHLSHRRLQTYPSTLSSTTNTLLGAPLPPWLVHPIIPRLHALGVFDATRHKAPNHVLVNEYQPGQGIMPHVDGDAYESVVGTVSLGGALCLELTGSPSLGRRRRRRGSGFSDADEGDDHEGDVEQQAKEENADAGTEAAYAFPPTRILQERRSLLVTSGIAYEALMHGISEVEADEDLRRETVANWDLLGDREGWEREGRNVRATRVSLTFRDVKRVSGVFGRVMGRR